MILPGLFYQSGIKVVANDLVTEYRTIVQYRFPRSKKKRIRKKWRKRRENFRPKTSYRAIMMGNTVYVHSKIIDAWKKALTEN